MEPLILVVDDDESIREFVALALSDEGYRVRCAPHGAAALEAIDRERPGLILLDMRMPVMDGWEFARRYEVTPDPRAPVVVLTAAVDAADRAAQIGADGYLAKPFDLEDLIEIVGRFAAGG